MRSRPNPAGLPRLVVLISFPTAQIVLSQWKHLSFSTGQNEIERYKGKHPESAIAVMQHADDPSGTEKTDFDAA